MYTVVQYGYRVYSVQLQFLGTRFLIRYYYDWHKVIKAEFQNLARN